MSLNVFRVLATAILLSIVSEDGIAQMRGCQNKVTEELNRVYGDIPQLFISLDCQSPKMVYINSVQYSDESGRLLRGMTSMVNYVKDIARVSGVRDPIEVLINSGSASTFTASSFTRGEAQVRRESGEMQRKLISEICNDSRRVSAIRQQCAVAGDFRNCMRIRAGSDWEKTLETGLFCN